MITEEERAAIEAEVDRDIAFKQANVPQCKKCKQPRPWDAYGQCRHCGQFADGFKDRQGHVYLFKCGDFVKVGRSVNVAGRLRTLNEANPLPVTLVGLFHSRDTYQDEKRIHKALAKHRRKGEWFRVSPVFKNDLMRIVSTCFGKEAKYGAI